MTPPPSVLKIHQKDNVGVALQMLNRGESWLGVEAAEDVSSGHKVALARIPAGKAILKYGYSIGIAKKEIHPGEHVHTHNMASALEGSHASAESNAGAPRSLFPASGSVCVPTFDGFRRSNGSVGIRNEIWIITTVGCVNSVASRIAKKANDELREGGLIDGVYAFSHPYGCSQLGGDLLTTQRLLAGLVKHPNAAGVLILGLGCENNQMNAFLDLIGDNNRENIRHFNAQDVPDEVETGVRLIRELAVNASRSKRTPIPASELILGMKCGGSDGLSGITANPLVGRLADRFGAMGGTSILSEVPEMFGAEKVLLDRAGSAQISDATVDLVNRFRDYFQSHGERIDENPSPGNKEGGITTLAEKSLGCVQKGGTVPVRQVLDYGQQATAGLGGIALLNGPGNDAVSGSVLSAAGAHMLLFTTGRGTPMGFPVPTIKISTNTPLALLKSHWIDFNAGPLADGTATMDALAEDLFHFVLEVASGRVRTCTEVAGSREISIWKDGVTL
jgi:altronate hydrolase